MANHAQNHSPHKNKKRIALAAVLGVLLLVGIGCGLAYSALNHAPNEDKAPVQSEPVQDKDTSKLVQKQLPDIDWEALRAANPDTIGWIIVPNTPINYPIMRPPFNNGNFYLDHNPQKAPDANGSIYLMPGDKLSDAVPLLLGHNMNDGSMFAAFADYIKPDVNPSQQEIKIETPGRERVLKPVAVFVVSDDNQECLIRPDTFNDIAPWAEKLFAQEHREFAKPDFNKQMWLFCTCKNDTNDKRIILAAQEVDE